MSNESREPVKGEPLPVKGESSEVLEGVGSLGDITPERVETRPAPPNSKATYTFKKQTVEPVGIIPDFMVGQPVLDLTRTDEDVQQDLIRNLHQYSPQELLRQSRTRLDDIRKDSLNSLKRRQAHLFLSMVLYPFIEGVARGAQIDPETQITLLIRRKETIGVLLSSTSSDIIDELMFDPTIAVWTGIARKFLKGEEADLRNGNVLEFWMDRIKETKASFYHILDNEPNGRWWLQESLVDCFNFMRGKLFYAVG